MTIFYKPHNAWLADVIPFYDEGRFRLFYLHDWRNKDKYGEGTPWYQISTSDFINFTEHGEMLSRGKKDEQDLYVFTGSIIKVGDTFHIFYVGHNPYFSKLGRPNQAIMHAISYDLLNWQKIPEDTFYAREDIYERDDWRDPFVFYNEAVDEYWMLLAARLKSGPVRRRGCIALSTSKDLKKWKVQEPFWSPNLYYTHEVPDLFRIGDWWYLVYSTFSEKFVTHYRMSKTLKGPWIAPVNDTFDGRVYYAAKTASDGIKRFAFGWNSTRDKEKDYSTWSWGGNLVVHEIVQNLDNSLSVKVPGTIDNYFKKELTQTFTPILGKWKIEKNKLSTDAIDSFSSAFVSKTPSSCKISATVKFGKNTRGCGIILRASSDLDKGYYIRLEPLNNRLVFDSWPREKSSLYPYYVSDNPFWLELERPIKLMSDILYEIKVFIEDTICEVYLNGEVAMSTRMYNLRKGRWGVFVQEGIAEFSNLNILAS